MMVLEEEFSFQRLRDCLNVHVGNFGSSPEAYAKAHGAYRFISGGETSEALLELTGAPTEVESQGVSKDGHFLAFFFSHVAV